MVSQMLGHACQKKDKKDKEDKKESSSKEPKAVGQHKSFKNHWTLVELASWSKQSRGL